MKQLIQPGNLARMIVFTVLALLFGAVQIANSRPSPQAAPPKIITKALPDAQVGATYVFVVEARGGKLPWTFTAKGLPDGVSFGDSDTLHGRPGVAGDFTVVVTVEDSSQPPQKSTATLKLHVNPAK